MAVTTDSAVRMTIIGVTGRMGRALVSAAGELPNVRLTGAVASSASPHLGRDAGELAGRSPIGVRVTSELPAALAQCDVAIDFSRGDLTASTLAACHAARKPLLIGTTGYPPELALEFERVARDIALLVAPNTSLGVTVLVELVRSCAAALPRDFDIEIIEAHHRSKRDAPSGTALALGRAAAEARGTDLDRAAVMSRTATEGPRREGEIGFAVVRGGDIVGEHSVVFAGTGEQVTLAHRATDRGIFARGALRAALWLASQPPGRYAMRDVLSLKTMT